MSRPQVLVVAKTMPWPANSGEKLRTLGLVRALAVHADVRVVGFVGAHEDVGLAARDGVGAVGVPRRAPRASWPWRAVRRGSLTAGKWWDPAMREAVTRELDRGVDLLVVSHVQLAGYLPEVRAPRTRTLLDMHNVESLLTARLAATTSRGRSAVLRLEARALRRLERRSVPRFDTVSVVSRPDQEELQRVVGPANVVVVPNAWSGYVRPLPPSEEPTACYVGLLGWQPNAEAVVAFVQDVWPRVRDRVPGARLLLVGRDPTTAVRALAGPDVEVTGTVEDVEPWYARSRVALAPLRAGGGSRLKILEALALGRPVVATTVGAEGLEDLHGRGVTVADDPGALADAVANLLADPGRSRREGLAGAAAVAADHTWDAAVEPVVADLSRVGS